MRANPKTHAITVFCSLMSLAGMAIWGSTASGADTDIPNLAVPLGALATITSGNSISRNQSVVATTTRNSEDPIPGGAQVATRPLATEIHDLNGINVIAINNGLNSRVSVSVQATLVFQAPR